MIVLARRHRFSVGIIAAYALLLSALLPAFASAADPMQVYLGQHLCGPGSADPNDGAPAPSEHRQKCQLCGPSCAMNGYAPVATLSDGVISSDPFFLITVSAAVRPNADEPSPLSLYPSDALSQGPPRAV
jgi:hypothetical protein